ncbi:sigma-70 family RNA polymerase sigma factor [Pseudomonas sp. B2M1-30]|uniref:sigma-70 family RNA polymerase sigma factor n=1 Tax=Pseudomonas TaxID=286 RepID=UPI0021CA592D|nr:MULTISPECIES: sigma-70 family RNA polymerase sigma factor [Pseudomonas]MCU0118880.1 sigma-70 family RNA polymerase sigma factor [Pseudomonas sp. B2M1-30]MCU7263362.1 sigma-70 family RNA polymerase sigma factor [Pseudomonas koreensis]
MSGAHSSHCKSVDALFRAHYRWLCERLRRHTGEAASAEDIAAETFAQLLQAPGLTAIREPRALLTTIAQRLLYQAWRRGDLERRHLQQLQLDGPDHGSSPEELAQLAQTLNRLDHSLQRLPGKVRSTFLLARIDGLTYPQIAAELGISQRSVSVYMTRSQALCDRHCANQSVTRPQLQNKRSA